MLKKMTAVILALVLGLISCQAFALKTQKDDNAVEPQYTHITNMGGSLDIQNGTAECSGRPEPVCGDDYCCAGYASKESDRQQGMDACMFMDRDC